jgi:type I restriction enzyme S subunit
MAEWRASTWGQEISLEYGKGIRGYADAIGPYRVFGSNGPIGWTSEALAQGPGVILGRKGAYRGVQFSNEPFFVIDTAYYVVPKAELDMRWLYYSIIHHKLGEIDDGSPIPSTTRSAVYVRGLTVPPPTEQAAIASVLSALDDKIELNRRMNETLEAMARAIFRDWLQRNADSIETISVSKLIDEGILSIGDGYRAKNSELSEPGLPFIKAGGLNAGFDVQGAEVLHESSVVLAREKISRIGDVAFTSKGTIGRFARVTSYTRRFVYSPQICFWRSLDPKRLHPDVLYLWMVSDDLKGQIDAVAGQTDMAPYVSLRDQRAMTMPRFNGDHLVIGDQIAPLLRLQDANHEENETLAATRDLLLPKLMSGEIRVKEAERLAETASPEEIAERLNHGEMRA